RRKRCAPSRRRKPRNGGRSSRPPTSRDNDSGGAAAAEETRAKMNRTLLAVWAVLASAVAAQAQGFSSKPVTVVIPLAAGGAVDTMVRTMADVMRGSLGQPVLVENMGGAGGVTGISRVARAEADGYTISVGTWGTHVVNAFVFSPPYDLIKDF